jgi:Fic family protein/DNA-binding XRE family transcriptional regulator
MMSQDYINQLKAILKTTALAQTQLAKQLGVTFATLNRWVNGHAKPYPKHIRAIQTLYRDRVAYPAVGQKALNELVRRANGLKCKGIWQAIAGNEHLREDLLLEHTYNSTSIEGTTFTKRQTEAVIFHQKIIEDKSYVEHLEVTNHAAVLSDILGQRIRGAITEEMIKTFHRRTLQGIRSDAGSYSRRQRGIRGVEIALTHPADIPEEMGDLVRSWNCRPSRKTIADIADFHIHFELIHPFADGNGRVGRLLMAFQCLTHDFPPAIIENARKTDYYNVLEYAQKKAHGPFVEFLVEEMEKTAKRVRKYL